MKDSKIPGSMDSGVFGGNWAPKAVQLSLSAAVESIFLVELSSIVGTSRAGPCRSAPQPRRASPVPSVVALEPRTKAPGRRRAGGEPNGAFRGGGQRSVLLI